MEKRPNIMAASGEGDSYRLHHLCRLVCYGNEHDNKRESRGSKTASGIRLPSNRGFMVDMTVTTETHIQARWILRALDKTATWARMTFKPKMSRGVAFRKGKITNNSNILVKTGRSPESNQTKIRK